MISLSPSSGIEERADGFDLVRDLCVGEGATGISEADLAVAEGAVASAFGVGAPMCSRDGRSELLISKPRGTV